MGFSVQLHLLPWGLADKYVVYQVINRFLLCTLGYKSRTRPKIKIKISLRGMWAWGKRKYICMVNPDHEVALV
jgi:hypothetical protein